ncbi:MAG: hypothetical protein WAO20_23220 [Acidobacteriota bacterium]
MTPYRLRMTDFNAGFPLSPPVEIEAPASVQFNSSQVVEIGGIIAICLVDHIIIGRNRHFRFADEDLL